MKPKHFVLFGAVVVALVAARAAAATVTTVMTGLDNPRGLAFASDGTLYVAEAGKGGSGPCRILRGLNQCYGPTGRISRLHNGVQSVAVSGLPSYITTEGQEAGSSTGPHDISLGRRPLITIGWGDDPRLRYGIWSQFGHLARVNLQTGSWQLSTDVSAYEAFANPDHGPIDSNPYGLLQLRGGFGFSRTLVTDAGGNDLVQVTSLGPFGSFVQTVAVFPSRSTEIPHPSCIFPNFPPITDSVPTAVTVGPDGAYYVSEVNGVPFCAGIANIYRVVPGHAPRILCGGFTNLMDLAFGPDGYLYVVQRSNGPVFFATPGDVVKVGANCSRTVVTPPLNRPGSLAFGPDGKLYVSVNSDAAGIGQVVRID